MHDPRDFLALARFANLGVLILGIGLAGMLVHRKPERFALSNGVCILGALLMIDGASMFHRQSPSLSLTMVALLLASGTAVTAFRRRNSRTET